MDIQACRALVRDLRRNSSSGVKLEAVVEATEERKYDFDPNSRQWAYHTADKADQKVAVVGEDGRARWQYVVGGRIVFKGGKNGEHSLDVLASTPERILAHWLGYCENNGLLKPVVGQLVSFPSGSSPSGYRYGKVLKVGSKRAVIAFTYKHGGKSTKTVPFNEIKF
jgi:hypothetical protein